MYINRTMHVEPFFYIYTSNHSYYNYLPFPHFLMGPASSSLIDLMDSQSSHFPLFLCFFFCCHPYTTSTISFSFPNFLPNDNNVIVSGTATKAQVDEHPSIRLTDNVDNLVKINIVPQAEHTITNPSHCGIPLQMSQQISQCYF